MRHPSFFIACLCAAALLAGCASLHPAKKEKKDDDDGLSWAQEPVAPATNGAIYQVGRDVALFENPIARHVGDVVTIVLSEATNAQKSATTTTPEVHERHASRHVSVRLAGHHPWRVGVERQYQ